MCSTSKTLSPDPCSCRREGLVSQQSSALSYASVLYGDHMHVNAHAEREQLGACARSSPEQGFRGDGMRGQPAPSAQFPPTLAWHTRQGTAGSRPEGRLGWSGTAAQGKSGAFSASWPVAAPETGFVPRLPRPAPLDLARFPVSWTHREMHAHICSLTLVAEVSAG